MSSSSVTMALWKKKSLFQGGEAVEDVRVQRCDVVAEEVKALSGR